MSKNLKKCFFLLGPAAILASVSAWAADPAPVTPAADAPLRQEQAAPVKRTAQEEKELAERRKKIQELKKEINGSEWKVRLIPSDKKEKEISDTLVFQNNAMESKALSDRGFGFTNYTITIPESGEFGIFETMKTGKEGIVFIRGEWTKDSMSGVINEQLDGGKVSKEYSFTSSGRINIEPSTESVPGSESVSASAQQTLVSKEEGSVEDSRKDKSDKKSKTLVSKPLF